VATITGRRPRYRRRAPCLGRSANARKIGFENHRFIGQTNHYTGGSHEALDPDAGLQERTMVERCTAQVLAAPLPEDLERELVMVDDALPTHLDILTRLAAQHPPSGCSAMP